MRSVELPKKLKRLPLREEFPVGGTGDRMYDCAVMIAKGIEPRVKTSMYHLLFTLNDPKAANKDVMDAAKTLAVYEHLRPRPTAEIGNGQIDFAWSEPESSDLDAATMQP
jgi:hypothetical protein